MILYLGATSLIKLYVEEDYSDIVREWVDQAEIVITCRVAYTQIMAAIDSRFRKGDIAPEDRDLLLASFSNDWGNFVTVNFDEYETGRLINKYGLKRMAAIHLSAAKVVKNKIGDIPLTFSSVNLTLDKAAESEGLRIAAYPVK